MEFDSGSMCSKIHYYGIPMPFCMFRNLVSDISEAVSWIYLLDSYLQTSTCHFDQVFTTLRRFPDNIHTRGVANISVQNRSYVYIEDISFFKNLLFGRDPVAYHIIQGNAGEF